MAADDEKKNHGNDFIDKLNVKNAKIIAICLVIGFSVFHGISHIKYGKFSFENYTIIMPFGLFT